MSDGGHRPLDLDGGPLSVHAVAAVARDPRRGVALCDEALARVAHGWSHIARIAERYTAGFERFQAGEADTMPVLDYGITTGFGEFKDRPVPPHELERLQRNILLSHSAGVGESTEPDDAANYFAPDVVRAVLLIRLNGFLKGHSGIRPRMVRAVEAMLDRGIVPLVPIRGSVGSSGDLCPLSHLFAVFLGAGRYYRLGDELRVPPAAEWKPASELPAELAGHPGEETGAETGEAAAWPPAPSFKEGLALVNGTTFTCAMLALAVADGETLANSADVSAALSLEAACGCARAFDPKVHAVRNMRGQSDSAANLRSLLASSTQVDSAGEVQDPYSLRCAPAVHGASRDALSYARMVVEQEIDAVTDNPLFFPGPGEERHSDEPWDAAFAANWPPGYDGRRRSSYSAGNFHGQPVGLAADFLAIAFAELANVAERRTQLLLDHHHSRGLPANLIPHRGVNSGFMLAQYSAASLVSENKVLAHPSSVDSIPTSANSEDHVAMATTAARKLRTVLANAQAVVAIELMVAAQGVEWRVGMERSPLARIVIGEAHRGDGLEKTRAAWREAGEEADRFARVTAAGSRDAIAGALGRGTAAAYRVVRAAIEPMTEDRPLDGDVRAVRRLLETGSLAAAVSEVLPDGLRPVVALRGGD